MSRGAAERQTPGECEQADSTNTLMVRLVHLQTLKLDFIAFQQHNQDVVVSNCSTHATLFFHPVGELEHATFDKVAKLQPMKPAPSLTLELPNT